VERFYLHRLPGERGEKKRNPPIRRGREAEGCLTPSRRWKKDQKKTKRTQTKGGDSSSHKFFNEEIPKEDTLRHQKKSMGMASTGRGGGNAEGVQSTCKNPEITKEKSGVESVLWP